MHMFVKIPILPKCFKSIYEQLVKCHLIANIRTRMSKKTYNKTPNLKPNRGSLPHYFSVPFSWKPPVKLTPRPLTP